MAELTLEQTPDINDYFAALKRRSVMIIFIAGIISSIGLFIAYTLPAVYESKSTILIEEQEIPTDLVRTTITSYAGQRIQVISQRVMTRTNLLETIEKYNLYADERKRKATEEIIAKMRADILIDMITASVVDPRSGQPTKATIAFSVGFAGKNPQTIQKVASELTTLYLNENLRTRAEKTEETSEFLEAEAKRLNAEIERMDAELAAFNEEHMGNLPESKDFTTKLLQQTDNSIEAIDDQLRSSNETRNFLLSQLALLEPHESDDKGVNPAVRLYSLKSNLLYLKSRYSESHPDVIAAKRDIRILEEELGKSPASEGVFSELDALQQELAVASKNYSDDHPDIKNLKRQIATLENIKNGKRIKLAGSDSPRPTNQAYITLKTQIETIGISEKLLRERQAKLRQKKEEHEQRLLLLPAIEGKYRALLRDYSNATARYQELKAKLMTAEVAQEMEKKRKGERFTLIDPAIVPSKPVSPNRPAIVILSLLLAFGGGLGAAFAAESMNTAVRGTKGLAAIVNAAPLAVIPYLGNEIDKIRKQRKLKVVVISVIVIIIITFMLIHFLISPLDVLFFRVLRRAGNLF